MPILVTCDNCSTPHRLKDSAVGKQFKCKTCGHELIAAAEDLAESDDIEVPGNNDDFADGLRPPKRKRSGNRSEPSKSSRSVRVSQTRLLTGINLVYIGFVMFVLVILGGAISGFFAPLRGLQSVALGRMPLVTIACILAGIVTAVGKLLCLTAPPQMTGKNFIIAAVSLDGVAFLLPILSLFVPLLRLFAMGANLISLAGFVCFVLFLKCVGQFVNEPDVVERADRVMTMGWCSIGSWIVMLGVVIFGGRGGLLLVAILGFVTLICGVMLAIRYAGLLNSCRYAVLEAK